MTIDPRLAPFIDAARDQVAEPQLTADALFDAWDRSRRRRTLWLATSGIAAAAAAVALLIGNAGPAPSEPAPAIVKADDFERVQMSTTSEPSASDATVIVSANAVAEAATNLGDHIAPEKAVVAIAEQLPVSTWNVAAAGYFAELETKIEAQRTSLKLDRRLQAEKLAREAEAAMAEGRRHEAIRLLATLVERYPRSSPARSAMLDLGRLYEAAGRKDEARCMYGDFLARWPHHSLRSEIDRRLARLGAGPACK